MYVPVWPRQGGAGKTTLRGRGSGDRDLVGSGVAIRPSLAPRSTGRCKPGEAGVAAVLLVLSDLRLVALRLAAAMRIADRKDIARRRSS